MLAARLEERGQIEAPAGVFGMAGDELPQILDGGVDMPDSGERNGVVESCGGAVGIVFKGALEQRERIFRLVQAGQGHSLAQKQRGVVGLLDQKAVKGLEGLLEVALYKKIAGTALGIAAIESDSQQLVGDMEDLFKRRRCGGNHCSSWLMNRGGRRGA